MTIEGWTDIWKIVDVSEIHHMEFVRCTALGFQHLWLLVFYTGKDIYIAKD